MTNYKKGAGMTQERAGSRLLRDAADAAKQKTINFECALPLSCAAAREEIGVPRPIK